jgi:hypothetical protein
MNVTPKSTKLSSSIGGAGSSATAGGYNQGLQFAASKGSQAGEGMITKKDLRGNNANSTTGYNQGAQFAASTGGEKPGTQKDLRGGNSNPNTGYNQGSQK